MQSKQNKLVQDVIRSAEEAREFWIGFVDFTEDMTNLPQVFSDYAKSLGVNSLTPEQKRQAFFNHILEKVSVDT